MFGIPNLWLILGLIASLIGGVAWHEHKVSSLKAEVLAEERQRVALASELLQNEEKKRNAGIIAQGEAEATAEEHEDKERERLLQEAVVKIAELEKGSKCLVSRETVRAINRGR